MQTHSILKQVRIEKALDIEQISTILNIKARFLKQIEDNKEFEINDSNLFLYYKKAYARFLGVNIQFTLDNNIEYVITRSHLPSFSVYFIILSTTVLCLLLL